MSCGELPKLCVDCAIDVAERACHCVCWCEGQLICFVRVVCKLVCPDPEWKNLYERRINPTTAVLLPLREYCMESEFSSC